MRALSRNIIVTIILLLLIGVALTPEAEGFEPQNDGLPCNTTSSGSR